MARKASASKTISTINHQDTRANIPTEELRGFVRDQEEAPEFAVYERDPALDPQLVWRGKKVEKLDVPVVPVYIQENIHPRAIIEDLPKAAKVEQEQQLDLFSDFNGLGGDFNKRVEFYEHEQHWTNRMILGDSLMVMTSLAEKERLKGKVQTIYIDPPYGIKFGSNWQVSTRKRDVKDGSATDATRQPEQVKAFRDTWKDGIHSYLNYLRDRLMVARDLLTETGSCFVQIGDENVHVVRNLMDEVFGPENFVSLISMAKTSGFSSNYLANVADYILWFGKDSSKTKFRTLYLEKIPGEEGSSMYKPLSSLPIDLDFWGESAQSRLARSDQLTSQGETKSGSEQILFKGAMYAPPQGLHWKTTTTGMKTLIAAKRVIVSGKRLAYLRFIDDFAAFPITNIWPIFGVGSDKRYVVETATKIVERCILMTTDPGDLVLDPTCGSGTTAYVAEQWGRRWITIDTSRVALALARTRLMAARFPFYHLADSPEGVKKEAELTGLTPPAYQTTGDIRKGFVYKRVPHITLKSIANNPDIHEGMTREEIDAAIARHAESETLFDQPYEDSSKVRVTGPFTVESLSPHRVLDPSDQDANGSVSQRERDTTADFTTMILDNLRKSGVQNGAKNERLAFDRLDPHAGVWIHATGVFTQSDGTEQRVAVSVGPEYGTVTADIIKEAAKEAVKGVGFDVLVVCGFAFGANVSDEVRNYGRLQVLPTKMNNDLVMGEEFLKKTGSGNLFMVFGEPDVSISRNAEDKVVVELKGVDVYDPTIGQIRSNSTDDIACWFIDTDYSGDAFFVRHAYFTGAQEPYAALKRSLRAEIDEDAWASLYQTVSRPFDVPSSGKIAVKVINHFGDEVMSVFEV